MFTKRPSLLWVDVPRRMSYPDAERLQLAIVAAKNAPRSCQSNDDGDAATFPSFPDVVLVLEHPPTITLGSQGTRADIVSSLSDIAQQGIAIHEADRGGKVTYHGPGQLMMYVMLNLRAMARQSGDVGAFVQGLQQTIVHTAAAMAMIATPRRGNELGVWIQGNDGVSRKVAAIGARLNRSTTFHGLCLNVTTNLDHYRHIIPCGLPWGTHLNKDNVTSHRPAVTSLWAELGEERCGDELMQTSRQLLMSSFCAVFGYEDNHIQTMSVEDLNIRLKQFHENMTVA